MGVSPQGPKGCCGFMGGAGYGSKVWEDDLRL